MSNALQNIPVEDVPMSELIVGVKCGGSDFTSGLCSNPALGKTSDLLLANGGTVIMGETTEIIGAEHLVAAKAVSEEVKAKLYKAIKGFEDEIERMGVDMRGGNPSPGNIAGGLSSIEEKSLGCISKAGNAPLKDVLPFADEIPGNGYYFMDSLLEMISNVLQEWQLLGFMWLCLQQEEEHRQAIQLYQLSK